MKKLIIFFTFYCLSNTVFSQLNLKEYKFNSSHQVDKTGNGSIIKSNHPVTIYFKDPKSITNENTDLSFRPSGKLVIKYSELKDPIENDIVFFGNTYDFASAKNQALYGVLKTDADFNTFVFVNKPMTIDGIQYKYLLIVGDTDTNSGSFKTYTIYCCK